MSVLGGKAEDICSIGAFQLLTQLYGPAVRCKPNVKKWRGLVLRICIRPLHGAFVLLAIMDIRAHPGISLGLPLGGSQRVALLRPLARPPLRTVHLVPLQSN